MKRRLCSRRFVGSRKRFRGLVPPWQSAQEPSRQTLDHDDGHAPLPRLDSRPRIRSRLAIVLGTVLVLGSLATVLCLPSASLNPRFPGNRFETPPLDHLIWWESFSEVEQTRGILRGLSLQAIAEIRRSYLRSRSENPAAPEDGPSPSLTDHDSALSTAIHAVRGRLDEFEGTEYELTFQSELLRLLRKAGQPTDWLNLYLELTYRQPGNPLIWMESSRALEAARSTGREGELHDAQNHWNQIPNRYRAESAGSDPSQPTRWPEPILP